MVEDPDNADQFALQIAVTSPELSNEDRAPMNITLVLDTSGSMGGVPIDLLRKVCTSIAGQLKEGDIISMVTWDTSNAIVLNSLAVAGASDPTLMEAIANIEAGGGTNLNGGLTAGYELAQQNFSANLINRIVLISDGGANAGATDLNFIANHAGNESEDGVYMVGVGVGEANYYNDELMDAVTDAGKGASVFVGSEDEAGLIFGERFVNTMGVAARNVRISLDLPPGFEMVQFSGEEFSTDPTEVEPQHISPNDSMVFLQTLETCAPEIVADDTEVTVSLHFLDGSTFEAQKVSGVYIC
jgi:Ca-activated chloride channel family protein